MAGGYLASYIQQAKQNMYVEVVFNKRLFMWQRVEQQINHMPLVIFNIIVPVL